MNKKEQILKYYEAWKKMGTTPKWIASKVGTTRQYVTQVMYYKGLEEEFSLTNRKPIFMPDLSEEDEIIEPDYIEYKEIKLLPKVNQLADGRTELIYESKLNYEL